ncbi:MAG: triose-phosphate isomerase [Candidatus Magasanikbacteria bacterium]|jgi:triosephosphate isomerase (TIM)|nr:triose-phosphate isomerase [Candidatus Magasanikbacteria bacterium]MBT4071793.1 triose-phosphate isomerase [Candidatus Magasanikbacteria bacterium]
MTHIFANWKMYLTHKETIILAKELKENLPDSSTSLAVFPSMLSAVGVLDELKDTEISVGAQNVAWTPSGAYTGAVSAVLCKEVGTNYALVGHSERRHVFGESNEVVRKKLEACLDAGIIPVLCIGETKEDLDAGKKEYRIKKQLMKALDGLKIPESGFFIAYEPVWAIGTGEHCMPEDVHEIHTFIKEELKQYTDKQIPLLYGGSVTDENVVSYTMLGSVDGVLVGGASTTYDSFISLIRAVDES